MDEAQYIQTVFGEWLPTAEMNISDEMKYEAVDTIMRLHGTELEMEEFIELYLILADDLKKTEEFGHKCTFMFADLSEACIYSRADCNLHSIIVEYMEMSNSLRAIGCGRVSVDGGAYIEFDEDTTLRDLGLEKGGHERLEFNCMLHDE